MGSLRCQLTGAAPRRVQARLLRTLVAQRIAARPLWLPLHAQPAARGSQTYGIHHAPRLFARSLSLPSSADLTAARRGEMRRRPRARVGVIVTSDEPADARGGPSSGLL